MIRFALALITGLLIAGCGSSAAAPQRTSTAATAATAKSSTDGHGATQSGRMVQLYAAGATPSPSHGDRLRAVLISGSAPAKVEDGTVLSDEDCAADSHGISHCRNRIRLAGGKEIEVRHPHDMTVVPCLAPGEHVMVMPPTA